MVSQGITLDRQRHSASASDQPLDLTASEFGLLDTLIRQPGRVFSRSELIDAALGPDALVLERTIDVHVRALRKKLGLHADLVETVRGVGYRFRDPKKGAEPFAERRVKFALSHLERSRYTSAPGLQEPAVGYSSVRGPLARRWPLHASHALFSTWISALAARFVARIIFSCAMQTLIYLTLASCLSATAPEEVLARDTVVVCPPTFLGALHPW